MIDNPSKAIAAKCPFYRRTANTNGRFYIFCEGLVENSGIKLWFDRKTDRETHFYTMCAYCYEDCCIYGAIMKSRYGETQ